VRSPKRSKCVVVQHRGCLHFECEREHRNGGALRTLAARVRSAKRSHVLPRHITTFLDGYCSTVQGLLDWFKVDLGFTELCFIHVLPRHITTKQARMHI